MSENWFKKVTEFVVRELLYQGYIASRLTGISPATAKRAISSAIRSRYILALTFSLFLIIIIATSKFAGINNQLYFPLSVFIWFFAPVFLSIMQVSYGASAGPQIREFLLSLPIEQTTIDSIAARSIISTISIPIYVSFAILVFSAFYIGLREMFVGILSAALSVTLALIFSALIFKLYKRTGYMGKLSILSRATSVIPMILIILLFGYIRTSYIQLNYAEKTLVPLVNLAGVTEGNQLSLTFALVYTVFAIIGSYLAFRSVAVSVLSPITEITSPIGKFRVKLRSVTSALVRSDFKVMIRSPRLVGLLLTPIMYAIIVIFTNLFQRQRPHDSLFYNVYFISNAIPVGVVAAFFPYVFYLAELKGYSYFALLPVSKFTDIKSKMLVSVSFYVASASILGLGFVISFSNFLFFIPLYAISLAVFACAIYSAIYFRRSLRSVMIGTIGLLNQFVYSLLNIVVFMIPVGIYTVGLFLTSNLLTPLPYLLISSIIEILFLSYILIKQK